MINPVGFHIPSRGLERPVLGEVKGPQRKGEGGAGRGGEKKGRDKFWMLEVIFSQVTKLGQTNYFDTVN